MNDYQVILHTAEETEKLAMRLASKLFPGDLIALEGDLGAGKTAFTKGIAKGLGIRRTVSSPTFTIMKQYQGKYPLYHFDVYRIENEDEELGFEEFFDGDGIAVVEWAHLVAGQLPEERLTIYLYHHGPTTRKIVFVPEGKRYQQICQQLFHIS